MVVTCDVEVARGVDREADGGDQITARGWSVITAKTAGSYIGQVPGAR